MRILLSRTFLKELGHYDARVRDELTALISKHHRGLNANLLTLAQISGWPLLKGYLSGKRVRTVILLQVGIAYVPIALYKKESRDGYNITTDSLSDYLQTLSRVQRDIIEKWDFESIEIE